MQISWSLEVTPANRWLKFRAAGDAGFAGFSPGLRPFRFRLQRLIGAGSTGSVYETKIINGAEEAETEGSVYAVKMVSKGGVGPEKERVTRLLKEAKFYATIEEARQRGRALKAVPCCYGLYETNHTVALVLDYAGDSLSGVEWQQLDAYEGSGIISSV